MSYDSPQEEETGSKSDHRRTSQPVTADDPGFAAFQMHQSKLELLLDVWIGALEKPLSESDDIVMDEIRHQIKTLLLDNTHDIYIKAVSVASSMNMIEE